MPKNTKIDRLRRRTDDAEAKYRMDPTAHRAKILKQRRRLLLRALNAGTGWQATHKMRSNGDGHRHGLVAARINLRAEA